MCIMYNVICTYYLPFSVSFFHIDIAFECIVLRCIVENKLTYLLTLRSLCVLEEVIVTMDLSTFNLILSLNQTDGKGRHIFR